MKKDFQFKALFFRVFAVFCFLFISQIAFSQSGKIFRDYNANGTQDSGELLVSGVIIKAYNASGALCASTTSSGTTSPNYTLPTTCSGQVRVEFEIPNTNADPTGPVASVDYTSYGGKTYGSSVQFVNAGATDVNFAMNAPADYCQANPRMFINCYVSGSYDGVTKDNHTLVGINYNDASDKDGNVNGTTVQGPPPSEPPVYSPAHPIPTSLADHKNIGSTWGLAYNKVSQTIYAASYIKAGSSLGPGESTGMIYQISTNGTPSTSTFVDLNAIFGANTAGPNPHPIATTSFKDADDYQTNKVLGKVGLGDIAISNDNKTLYAVNLFDRKLYQIPTTGTPSASNIQSFAIPTAGLPTLSGTCPTSDMRPFGIGLDRAGTVFVGAVCSAESVSSGQDTDPNLGSPSLTAYVWKFVNGTFTLVMNAPLNFNRDNKDGYVTYDDHVNETYNLDWEPWSDLTSPALDFKPVGQNEPMLSDIIFDDNGDMIIGMRDRMGDCVSYIGGFTSSGDIYKACYVGNDTWKMENNAQCGSVTTGGANNNEGPGGGEYFFEDIQGDGLANSGNGGIFLLHSTNQIVSTATDAVNTDSNGNVLFAPGAGGIQVYNNGNGKLDGAFNLYENGDVGTFSKASGIGAIAAQCNLSPLEIGNRIWNDKDKDGIQDADEVGISNVTVELYDGNTLVGTTITDANGNWYFNETNVADGSADVGTQLGVQPSKTYSIRIGSANWVGGNGLGDLSNLVLTKVDASSSGLQDFSDSDASLINSIPTITYTTGDYGQNNHTLDMGFSCIQLNAGSDQTFCQPNDGKYKFNDAPSGQTWTKFSGSSSIDGSTGQIIGLTAGTHEFILKYTTTSDCSDTVKLTVNAVPDLAITSTSATCPPSGGNANDDAKINLVTTTNGEKVDYTSGSTYTGTKSYASLPTGMPSGNVFTVPNPSVTKNFTVRLYNNGGTCFIDKTLEIKHIDCPKICPPNTCLPISSEKN